MRDRLNESFVDLGDQTLKNIARPMRAYALTSATGGRPAIPPAIVAPKPLDRRQRLAAFGSKAITILENVARLTGAIAERAATGSRDDVRPASEVGPATDVLNAARRSRDRRLRRALIVSALIVFAAARAWRGQDSSTPPSPALSPGVAVTDSKLASAPRLSIVVLPFANLSGDPEQDTLADGLTDDLTTDLTHLPDSFVIGRSAATAYKGKRVDLRHLGRHLGVRYALEGSVRRAGETITVNAQLISTETGADVWADRLEGERGRLAELQTELVSRLAKSLKVS